MTNKYHSLAFWANFPNTIDMSKTKAILVDIVSPETTKEESKNRLEELENLVNTYGGVVVIQTIQKRDTPDYENYIGKGKIDEIIELAQSHQPDILVINNLLKPRQIFNVQEKFRKENIDLKVWDRVDLILKIFDKHAKSTEAKLQIELAGIRHMGPRIYGMGIELSRQAGAMGVRAGQGESNIEMMKRHLREQELSIQKKLQHYEDVRIGHRNRRRRQDFKTVALVGYTNAGKSSLLNALTNKGAYVADKLFATLDTRVGKLFVPSKEEGVGYQKGTEILISDTIGFIQDLPPSLIKAFKSTLSETVDAELLLHVIDVNDPQIEKKIIVVEEILKQLGLENKPKIYVFNKIDLIRIPDPIVSMPPELTEQDQAEIDAEGKPRGMLKASPRASHILGWSAKELAVRERRLAPPVPIHNNPKKLTKQYKEFSPVTVSAHEKINLSELIEEIIKQL